MNIDYHALLPVEIVAATILLVLVVDLFLPLRAKAASMWVGFVGVGAALGAVISLVGGGDRIVFGGAYVVDAFTLIFQGFFLIAALVVLLISYRYLRDGGFYQGEYYFLLLTAFLGCTLMPASRNLLMLFLALELVSAPGFLLAAFRKSDIRGNEGGLKFFIIGVLSTAVMLYGMSLIYGLTGRLELHAIAQGLTGLTGARETLADVAIVFVVIGFAFKVSAVPFQFWAPDTYEGAPVPVAGFLAVASAAAGFAGLLQLMFVAFVGQATFWAPIFAVLSVLTMTLGNLVALRQTQTIRLLAYSGIAQSGYILLPFALVSADAAVNHTAFQAAVVYILIYAVMNIGAYAVSTAVAERHPSLQIEDFAGLARTAPLLAVAMTAFMVSLAGVPPTGGFWGKLAIFAAAIQRGGVGPWL
ncbi:MAG TPA: NADH-quinone oxidoreductase subunit N, partial [Actinomycetota bacterium]|nr:NADH-quinone oxidoreductase subunit N [Actinomycetota bacterium]